MSCRRSWTWSTRPTGRKIFIQTEKIFNSYFSVETTNPEVAFKTDPRFPSLADVARVRHKLRVVREGGGGGAGDIVGVVGVDTSGGGGVADLGPLAVSQHHQHRGLGSRDCP